MFWTGNLFTAVCPIGNLNIDRNPSGWKAETVGVNFPGVVKELNSALRSSYPEVVM